jgi:alpha-1,3-rhamnosyltransferase
MLVTVVIPSYNHSSYVAQAIDSVLGQTWPHIDLIVIDDGSHDGSADIIRQLHSARGGFRCVTRENRGLIESLNEGLTLARGDFFCELASDDFFPQDSVEQRIRYLIEHPECVAVYADGYLIEQRAPARSSLIKDKHRRMFAAQDPIPAMLKGALPVFSTGLIKRTALQGIGGFDVKNLRYYEDLDTPILLSTQGKIGFIDEKVIYRRHHETNVSINTNHIRVEKVLCYNKLFKDERLASYRRLTKKAYLKSLLALGRHINRNGGGNEREIAAFRYGWSIAYYDFRLMWYLMKWARTI